MQTVTEIERTFSQPVRFVWWVAHFRAARWAKRGVLKTLNVIEWKSHSLCCHDELIVSWIFSVAHCAVTTFLYCPLHGRDYLASATEEISSPPHLSADFRSRLLGASAGTSLIYSTLQTRVLHKFTLTRAIQESFFFPLAGTIKPSSFSSLALWGTKRGTR